MEYRKEIDRFKFHVIAQVDSKPFKIYIYTTRITLVDQLQNL